MSSERVWEEYAIEKQAYSQLASKYNCSLRTIQRKVDNYSPARNKQPFCTCEGVGQNIAAFLFITPDLTIKEFCKISCRSCLVLFVFVLSFPLILIGKPYFL